MKITNKTNCKLTRYIAATLLVCLHIQVTYAQSLNVKGIVNNHLQEPLAGVTINAINTTLSTQTDENGTFQLILGKGEVLHFNYQGYIPQQISLNEFIPQSDGSYHIEVTLEPDNLLMDEVVVIGYGTQKKVNLTGSVASINAEALANRPATNVSSALQGTLPGVTVVQNSGQPGKDNATIRIRGVGTLNNANPMYVVDGITVSTINDIDPNDIESISVLKDAASAAIYGSRASNGVVLVTTKRGSSDVPMVKYDGYFGGQSPTALPEYLPSHEYAALLNSALENEGRNPLYTSEEIGKFRDGSDPDNYPNTDWLGLFYKDQGLQHGHRLEVSANNGITNYMFSAGYLGQDGIIETATFERYTFRGNINTQIGKLFAGANFSHAYGNTTEPSNPYTGDMYQIFRQINRIAPFVPYKYSNGHYGYIPDGSPLAWMDEGSFRNEQYRTTRLAGNIGYEFIPGLKLQQVAGYEYSGRSDERFIKDLQFYNWQTGEPTMYQGPNQQQDRRDDNMMVNLQTLLTYNGSFGRHTVGGLAGFAQEYHRGDWTLGRRINFLTNDLWELNAGSPEGQVAEGSANEYAIRSFFGRVTYDYDGRYLFEANVRRDGTSRIIRDARWSTFPSFSAAWRIINEPFMDEARNLFSDLKIRASWGQLGNEQIGNYPYQSVLSQRNYPFGGRVNQGVAPVDGSNIALLWETSESTNLGLDVGLFSNAVILSLEVYKRTTHDILMQLPVSTLYGLNAPYQNAGKVENKGLELQLGYTYRKGDFNVNVLANAGYNHNEVLDLQNDGAKIWLNAYSFRQEGRPVNSFGGYEVLGIFQSQEQVDQNAVINRATAGPGDFMYKDQNNDGRIDGEDRVYLGSWDPSWTFGSSINVGWKRFYASVLLQGAADVLGYLQNETIGQLTGNTSKPTTLFRDSWDAETNPSGTFPRPLTTWNQNGSEANPSSYWIINSSYLRVKNIQLGYNLPQQICDVLRLSAARIYYSGQNLFTISGFNKGFDPEAPVAARAYYPQVKTNTIGLNVTF